jgi:hypothetical protein
MVHVVVEARGTLRFRDYARVLVDGEKPRPSTADVRGVESSRLLVSNPWKFLFHSTSCNKNKPDAVALGNKAILDYAPQMDADAARYLIERLLGDEMS